MAFTSGSIYEINARAKNANGWGDWQQTVKGHRRPNNTEEEDSDSGNN